jgi:hypothetical protein
MVQHATAAVSIVGSILLCLVFIGLVYDLIAGYSPDVVLRNCCR